MNEERIDEIAFEAGCHRHKYWDPKHPDLEGFIISQAALDKFAESVIMECAKFLDEKSDHDDFVAKVAPLLKRG